MARLFIDSPYAFDYAIREPREGAGPPRELIVLLHGYAQHGRKILRDLDPVLPSNALVWAPNGPYPLPYPVDDHFKVANAWYFYDAKKDEYFIPPLLSATLLERAFGELARERGEIKDLPIRIVGFSQGGYLAPFVGTRLPNVKRVVLLAASLLPEELPARSDFFVNAIHGDADDVVPIEEARARHADFVGAGNRGAFETVTGAGHSILALRDALGRVLNGSESS